MKGYDKIGTYAGYDKNHKERDALDYYSTPIEEVENILKKLDIDFDGEVILEPCAGGGHMVQGILNYLNQQNLSIKPLIIATDVQKREGIYDKIQSGLNFDFLSEDYPYINNIDWIIMNPPYSTIEPFTMKALEIADKGVIMLARLQFLEGQKRYENILKNNPPQDIYIYVDRIACYKNGDSSQKMSSVQAYCWVVWRKDLIKHQPTLHWIRRAEK